MPSPTMDTRVPDAKMDQLFSLRRQLADSVAEQKQDKARELIAIVAGTELAKIDGRELDDYSNELSETVRLCMSVLSTDSLLMQTQADLISMLNKAPASLRQTVIDQLALSVKRDPVRATSLLCAEAQAVLIAVIRLLPGEHTSSASCVRLFAAIVAVPNQAKVLFNIKPLTDELVQQSKSPKTTVRFCVYDFMVELCSISNDALAACERLGLVNGLVTELSNADDVLCQLNALESLANLCAKSRLAIDRLHSAGILPQVYEMLEHNMHSVDYGGFLFPGIVRFFGYLAAAHPSDCFNKYPRFVQSVFSLCLTYDTLDVAQRLLAFDTLAVIGRSVDGKMELAKYDNKMRPAMAQFANAIRSSPSDLRERHLQALADLFELPLDQQTSSLLECTSRWFIWLDAERGAYGDVLLAYYKQPIKQIRLAAGGVFRQLATQPWAQQMMSNTDGFMQFLLDRDTEHEHVCRQLKYDLICTLLDSPTAERHFTSEHWHAMARYRAQGVHFVEAQHDIATEGAD